MWGNTAAECSIFQEIEQNIQLLNTVERWFIVNSRQTVLGCPSSVLNYNINRKV